MQRRRAEPGIEVRRLKIAESSVTFDYSELSLPSHSILIDGEIDLPVLRTKKVAITVLSTRGEEQPGAVALGVSGGVWRIAASFSAGDFALLMTMAAGRKLAIGELTSEPIHYGRGTIRSIALTSQHSG